MENFQVLLCLIGQLCILLLACNASSEIPKESDGYEISKKCDGTSGCHFPWHYCDNGTCTCGPDAPYDHLFCNYIGELNVTTTLCITFDEATNSTYLGLCLYTTNNGDYATYPYDPHELDDVLCGKRFNRTGTLCGKCRDGHYPLAHSFDMNCVECSSKNWLKLVLATFLPLTIFYFVVMLFKINVTSSHLGFMLFCQGLTSPALARMFLQSSVKWEQFKVAFRYIASLYSIWNLDLLRFFKLDICLGTSTLQTLSLEFCVGVYPYLLILLSYILLRLSDSNLKLLCVRSRLFRALFRVFNRHWEVKGSLVDAFATFFLLSSMKFLNVSFDLLTPIVLYQLNSTGHLTYSWRLYYDATVPYFGKTHLPYAILSIAVLTVFVFLPTLLLILYPFHWFQKLLNVFPFRWYILHTFMDTFQGCYKDGTEPGTRDYRWFSSMYFVTVMFAMALGATTLYGTFFPLMSMALIVLTALFIVLQPYKSSCSHYSLINSMFMLLLAVIYVSLSSFQIARRDRNLKIMAYLFIGASTTFITPIYILALILKWVYNQKHFFVICVKKLLYLKQGYRALQ